MSGGYLRREARKVRRARTRRKAKAVARQVGLPLSTATKLVKQLWPRRAR